MATAKYGLKPSPQRLIFRYLVKAFRSDPTLSRVVQSWQVWDDDLPNNLRDPAITEMPCVRLSPSQGPDQFWGPEAFVGTLSVLIELYLPACDADDALDLYYAIRRAIYPTDPARRLTIHRQLVQNGARAEFTARFSQPNFRAFPDAKGGAFTRAAGMLQLDILEQLNP